MQKRNILFLSSWYPNRIKPTHGNFVYQHALAVSKFHQVHVVYVCLDDQLNGGTEIIKNNDPFPSTIAYISKSRIPFIGPLWNYLRMILCYFQLVRNLRKEGFHSELIHANIVYPIGIIARLLSIRFKVPYIITEHWTCYHQEAYPRPSKLQQFLTRLVANKASIILPVSENLAHAMRKFGIRSEMNVVYNVIDTTVFVPGKQKERLGNKLIHVSSLDTVQKNPLLLFHAFAEICKWKPEIQLHIVSDGDFSLFKQEIKQLNIEQNTFFHGTLDANEIAALLQDSDLFVLTSRFENLPCVLIEAISCGVPIVSTNVGGIKEIVHSTEGQLVPSEDQDALVTAIKEQLTRLDRYDSIEMHQKASENFSYHTIGTRLGEIYESIIMKHVS
jgi:glycosyltransferase involved in cell wall biosynthesis